MVSEASTYRDKLHFSSHSRFYLENTKRKKNTNLKSDRLASEGLDENLHASTETQHQMQSGLLLDVIVRQGATILELLAGKDQTLLIGRDTFLVLNFGLHILDGVGSLDLEGNSLASESLYENLHPVMMKFG